MTIPSIAIWEGCDPIVSEAVERFRDRWRPSSTDAHTLRLMEELINPAVATYMAALPATYSGYIPGAGIMPLSEVACLVGVNAVRRVQQRQLHLFIQTRDSQSDRDQQFIATLETLIELIAACARKRPDRAQVRDTRFDNKRRQGFCRFCGASAEFTSFAAGNDDIEIYPLEVTTQRPQKTLRLSSLYCVEHRPKSANGDWNPVYRAAKRSLVQFDRELARLTQQSARLQIGQARSGDPLVDSYIYHYVRIYGFQPADEAELRHHARWMVASKLTDRKKQMVMLQRYGTSQSDIARKLGVERQAVFKALASIPKMYCQLPTLPGFSSHFLTPTRLAD